MLDRSVLRDLNSLGAKADTVALHLIAAGIEMDGDLDKALAHARTARDMAPRIAAVREAAGLVAYQAGEWAEAVRDLRAARRMNGDDRHLPMLADCERALGRPERALTIATSPEVAKLPKEIQAEMAIVHAGARADLGELPAAARVLERFGVEESQAAPWSFRTWYAYADILAKMGKTEQAIRWFAAASGLDQDGETDAADRVDELSADTDSEPTSTTE